MRIKVTATPAAKYDPTLDPELVGALALKLTDQQHNVLTLLATGPRMVTSYSRAVVERLVERELVERDPRPFTYAITNLGKTVLAARKAAGR